MLDFSFFFDFLNSFTSFENFSLPPSLKVVFQLDFIAAVFSSQYHFEYRYSKGSSVLESISSAISVRNTNSYPNNAHFSLEARRFQSVFLTTFILSMLFIFISKQIVLWSVSCFPLILYKPSSSMSILVTMAHMAGHATTKSIADISLVFFVFLSLFLHISHCHSESLNGSL